MVDLSLVVLRIHAPCAPAQLKRTVLEHQRAGKRDGNDVEQQHQSTAPLELNRKEKQANENGGKGQGIRLYEQTRSACYTAFGMKEGATHRNQ